jgi:hypothetical protein
LLLEVGVCDTLAAPFKGVPENGAVLSQGDEGRMAAKAEDLTGRRGFSAGDPLAALGDGRLPTDHQEVVWHFAVTEVEPVEGWLEHHSSRSGSVCAPESTEELTYAYYHTEAWRFYRAGYALRGRAARRSQDKARKAGKAVR